MTDLTPTQILELIRLTIRQGAQAVFGLRGDRVIFRAVPTEETPGEEDSPS